MKSKVSTFISTIFCSSIILAFSNVVLAADWDWAQDETINLNFGQSAGWVIDGVTFEGGEETIVTDEDGNQAVCCDYLITVDKHRESDPQSREKYQEVLKVEIETFCQPLEEEEAYLIQIRSMKSEKSHIMCGISSPTLLPHYDFRLFRVERHQPCRGHNSLHFRLTRHWTSGIFRATFVRPIRPIMAFST